MKTTAPPITWTWRIQFKSPLLMACGHQNMHSNRFVLLLSQWNKCLHIFYWVDIFYIFKMLLDWYSWIVSYSMIHFSFTVFGCFNVTNYCFVFLSLNYTYLPKDCTLVMLRGVEKTGSHFIFNTKIGCHGNIHSNSRNQMCLHFFDNFLLGIMQSLIDIKINTYMLWLT